MNNLIEYIEYYVDNIEIKKIVLLKGIGIVLLYEIIIFILTIISFSFISVIFKIFNINLFLTLIEGQSLIINFKYVWAEFIISNLLNGISILIIINMFKEKNYVHTKQGYFYLSRRQFIYGALLILGYCMMRWALLDKLLIGLPIPKWLTNLTISINRFNENNIFIVGIITVLICSPILEELFYRGVLLNGLLKRYNSKLAIIISAIIFGVMHLNLPQFINATILGIIFGLLYYYTKSIWFCMYIHFINNALAIVAIQPKNFLVNIIISIIVFVFGVLLFIKSLNEIKKYRI